MPFATKVLRNKGELSQSEGECGDWRSLAGLWTCSIYKPQFIKSRYTRYTRGHEKQQIYGFHIAHLSQCRCANGVLAILSSGCLQGLPSHDCLEASAVCFCPPYSTINLF